MADDELLDKVQDLSDLELAALLCLATQEHCIIDTEPDALDDLVLELQLVGDIKCSDCFEIINNVRLHLMSLDLHKPWSIVVSISAWMISPIQSLRMTLDQNVPSHP